jgi:5-methylcytosine-specific restriction protein A
MPTINKKQSNASKPPHTKMAGDKKQERQAIYNTTRWHRLRKEVLMQHPICEICGKNLAEHVHHVFSFMDFEGQTRIDVAFDSNNLMSVCAECHTRIHNCNNEVEE